MKQREERESNIHPLSKISQVPTSLANYQKNSRVLKLDTSYLSQSELFRSKCHIWGATFGGQGRLVSGKCLRDLKWGGWEWQVCCRTSAKGGFSLLPMHHGTFQPKATK